MAVETLYSTEIPNNSRTVSGLVTIFRDDVSLLCNTSGGAVNIFLLQIPANNWNTEYILYVKDISGNAAINNITLTAPAGFLINGNQTYVISTNFEAIEVTISSNTDYLVSAGANATPGLTEIVIARTAFVSKNGSNSTGLIERLDKPFATIAAATNALFNAAYGATPYYNNPSPGQWLSVASATDRLLIKAFTGYYPEPVNLVPFFDFDLSDVVIGGGNSVAIQDQGVSCDSIVYGSFVIDAGIKITGTNSNVRIYADTINAGSDGAVNNSAGNCVINIPNINFSAGYSPFGNSGVTTTGGRTIINNSRLINSSNGLCVWGLAGTLIINNCTMTIVPNGAGVNSADGTIYVYGGNQSNAPVKSTCIQKVSSILIDSNVQ